MMTRAPQSCVTSSQVRRPDAVLLSSTTSAEVARVFIGTWASWFGVPADISSDQGPQFTSELWNAVAEGLGMRPHCTTAYHPQANGFCEQFQRSMKAALRASLRDSSWIDRLPWVMLDLRTAPTRGTYRQVGLWPTVVGPWGFYPQQRDPMDCVESSDHAPGQRQSVHTSSHVPAWSPTDPRNQIW